MMDVQELATPLCEKSVANLMVPHIWQKNRKDKISIERGFPYQHTISIKPAEIRLIRASDDV